MNQNERNDDAWSYAHGIMNNNDKHYDEQKRDHAYVLGLNDGRKSMKLDILYMVRSHTGHELTLAQLVKDIGDIA